MNEKLLKIINHYGVMPQLKYFQSEVFVLNEAIIEYEFIKKDNYEEEAIYNMKKWDEDFFKNHVAEEIADVLVMVYQFLEYYGIDQVEVCKTMDYKIDRQIERIENENN